MPYLINGIFESLTFRAKLQDPKISRSQDQCYTGSYLFRDISHLKIKLGKLKLKKCCPVAYLGFQKGGGNLENWAKLFMQNATQFFSIFVHFRHTWSGIRVRFYDAPVRPGRRWSPVVKWCSSLTFRAKLQGPPWLYYCEPVFYFSALLLHEFVSLAWRR